MQTEEKRELQNVSLNIEKPSSHLIKKAPMAVTKQNGRCRISNAKTMVTQYFSQEQTICREESALLRCTELHFARLKYG